MSNKKAIANPESKWHRCYIRPQGVTCDSDAYACKTCGWNYEIEKKRKEKLGVDIDEEAKDAS